MRPGTPSDAYYESTWKAFNDTYNLVSAARSQWTGVKVLLMATQIKDANLTVHPFTGINVGATKEFMKLAFTQSISGTPAGLGSLNNDDLHVLDLEDLSQGQNPDVLDHSAPEKNLHLTAAEHQGLAPLVLAHIETIMEV